VAHSFSKRGNYTVKLTVTDDAGGVSSMNLAVSVIDRTPVMLSTSPVTAPGMVAGKQAVFSVNARDPDGDPLNYTWTVDGSPAGQNSETFTYKPTSSGTHVIAVSVSDGEQAVKNEWSVTVKDVTIANDNVSLFPLVAGMLVVVVLVIAIAVVAIRRRRPA